MNVVRSVYWEIHEDVLRAEMARVGVTDIRRWDCPCAHTRCRTYVLYGRGREDAVWLVCSVAFAGDKIALRGAQSGADIAALPAAYPADPGLGEVIGDLLGLGLEPVLHCSLAP